MRASCTLLLAATAFMAEDKTVRKLREQVETALAKRKDDDAITLLGKLIEAEPKTPRWPHKRGELYRKKNRIREAIDCYSLAADLYAEQGFIARAVAMAKTIIDIDPRATYVLERIDPEAARRLHRQQRPTAISAQPGPMTHAAVLPEDDIPPLHPALLPESLPPAPAPARPASPVPARPAIAPRDKPAEKRPPAAAAPHPPAKAASPRLRPRPNSVLDLAEELKPAPDAKPNETRFSNAPPAPGGIHLDITDIELEPRKPAAQLQSIPPAPPPARSLASLPLFPLFAELPREALVELVKGSEVIEQDDQAVVMRRGEPLDALYGIVEGSVEILVPGQDAKITLAEGDVFGESSLLAGEKGYADAVVRGHLVALKIPRRTFNQIAAQHPVLAEVLLELLTRRLLGNLLQSSPLFLEFDAAGRKELAHKFEIRRAPPGTVLAAEGKLMDGLYVNLTGTLEVTYPDGRPAEHHDSGTMFGQNGLLSSEPSDVTVRAVGPTLVLRLPSAAFHTIAMQYPGVLATVSELPSVAKISM